jgi:uncharacterized protein YigE (DUF2233 family)
MSLWILAIAFMGYFSWQYYTVTASESEKIQGRIKMKNVAHSSLPKIEANKAERVMMNGNIYSTYTVDLKASKLAFYHKTPERKPIGTFKYLYEYLNQQSRSLFLLQMVVFIPKLYNHLGFILKTERK